jgi:hypothetical protein
MIWILRIFVNNYSFVVFKISINLDELFRHNPFLERKMFLKDKMNYLEYDELFRI